jgi:zinc and cadmium transporter
VPDEAPEGVEEGVAEHEHTLDSHEHCEHDHTLADKSARHLSWTGAAFGLTLHTLIDGFAVAASVKAEGSGDADGGWLGLGTFLVVILHKPFDAMAIATLMTASGWSKFSRHVVNALFALAIPAGMLLFHFGAGQFSEAGHFFLGSVLAFTAGTFICIAASDLLPELQFHAHDRGKLTVALIAGLGVSVLIGMFETTGHDHKDPPRQGVTNDTHGAGPPPEKH